MRNTCERGSGALAARRARLRKCRHLDPRAAEFFGVVLNFRRMRIVVHPTRKTYLIQHCGHDGKWETWRRVPLGSLLQSALVYECELAEASKLLPEHPSDAVEALRLGGLPVTAAQVASAARRARAALRRKLRCS